MKILKLSVLVIVFATSVTAQPLAFPINVGYLAMNAPFSKIVDSSGKSVVVPTTRRDRLYPPQGLIIEDVIDSTLPSKYTDRYVEGYKLYKTSKIEINDLTLTDVSFVCLNDTLIHVSCAINRELTEILTFKYGEPKRTAKYDTVICTYKFTGAKNPLVAYSIDTKWRCGGSSANEFMWKYYDDNCKENGINTMTISFDSKYSKYLQLVSERSEHLKEMEREKKTKEFSKY